MKRFNEVHSSFVGRVLSALLIVLANTLPALADNVTHTYDDLNRLIKSDYGNGTFIEYSYDAAGNRLTKQVVVPNKPPIANAGPDQTVNTGVKVTLDGAGSSDPDNSPAPLSYSWSQTGSPVVTLANPNSASPSFTPITAGSYLFNLIVSDGQLNSAPDSVTVTVKGSSYNFTGFFPPVDNLPTLNTVKSGSSVPVKFSLGGNQGLNILATGYPKSQSVSCSSNGPNDAIEETDSSGSSGLSYEASTDQYKYVWKTTKTWKGTCRQFVLKLEDGSEHKANFMFQ